MQSITDTTKRIAVMPTPPETPSLLEEIERRLAFMIMAAANDDINPSYMEGLEKCHGLALDALAP